MSENPNNQQQNIQQVDDDKFDVTGLLLDYLSHWKWFLLSIIVFVALMYWYVSTIVPQYEVGASIYINNDKTVNSGKMLPGLEGLDLEATSYMDETEIEILKSKNNLKKIVDSLDLAYEYYNIAGLRDEPVYRSSAVLARMDSVSLNTLKAPVEITIHRNGDKYDIEARTRLSGDEEKVSVTADKLPADVKTSLGVVTLYQSPFTKDMTGNRERIVVRNPEVKAAEIAADLTIQQAEKAQGILRMAIQTPLVEEGTEILKAIVHFYNRQIIDDKNRSAIQTEAFILDRLVMINGELKDVEERLRTYREQHNISDLQAQTAMNLSQQSNTEAQLAQADADMEILNDIERRVQQQDSYSTLPSYSNNEAVTQSIEAYNQGVANYERSLESLGDDHPRMAKLRDELIKQKSQIVSNITAAKKEVASRRRAIANIENRSTGQLAVQPKIDKGLNEIFREQQVKVNIYTFLLQKREEIALQKTLATPTAQFIDNPVGEGPVSPNRMMYLAIGLLVGLLLPALIILLRRILFPKFSDKEDLERLTKVPILGEICQDSKAVQQNSVVVGANVSTTIAELFRLLRNNINFIGTAQSRPKVILVTSSVSGEGKTFIAINLATSMALTGKRTIVVGLDVRRPVLSRLVGANNHRGATTYLSGQETDLDSLIIQSDIDPNLYVLPAGPVPPNPNELLLSANMQHMIDQLKAQFDYVIIDSAPIGMVSDSFLIVPHSDVQLYVTRAGVSSAKGLKVLHESIRAGRLPKVYLVLNGVNVGSTAYVYRRYGGYGYYSRQSYGYGYGYGSSSDDSGTHHHHSHKKRPWYKKLFSRKK